MTRLLKLSLRNFKGCRELDLSPNGKDLAIYADNGVGKTTIADAYLWLLFDKDTKNRKDFEIKTLGADGKPKHHLEHSVSAVWELATGGTIELTKVYKEKWAKPRGKATAEFDGHTTDYFINQVPVAKKEYDARIASICDEKTFRLLSDPTYFSEGLSWQDRRKMLLAVTGDISDADVIAASPALAELTEILGGRTTDEHRAALTATRRKLNERREEIPARIDELSRSLPESLERIDTAVLEALAQKAREEIASIRSGEALAQARVRVQEIRADIARLSVEAKADTTALDKARAQFQAVSNRVATIESDASTLEAAVSALKTQVASAEREIASTRADYSALQSKTFTAPGVERTCYACGQDIPGDKIAESIAKAEATWNERRAKDLEAIIARGKALKADLETKTAQLANVEANLAGAKQALEEAKAEKAEARAAMDAEHSKLATGPAESPDLDKARAALQAAEAAVQAMEAEVSESVAEAQGRLETAQEELARANAANAAVDAAKQTKARINELAAEETELGAKLERIDFELHLCEEFVRAKVALLEARVNDHFKLVKFRLFEDLINGGLQEVCEATVNGVPYGSLNHGSRINAGLDIINTLAKAQGMAPPIFVDNAESITNLLPTKGQQIRLIVSAADKTLRVEPSKEFAAV